MNKFILFLKRRGVQMMPFLITSLSVVAAYAIAVLHVIGKYCDHDCRGNIWEPVFFFTTSFLLGSLALLFVRRRVIAFWALFFLLYIYISRISWRATYRVDVWSWSSRLLFSNTWPRALRNHHPLGNHSLAHYSTL